MVDWQEIEQAISQAIKQPFSVIQQENIFGGSINQAMQIKGFIDGQLSTHYFIKFNQKNRLPMFEAEAAGLQLIEKTGTIRVPHVICSGVAKSQSFLVLEAITFNRAQDNSDQLFGSQLASLHKNCEPQFGWSINNTIGSTPQLNSWTTGWIEFWREQRLGYQLSLARQQGAPRSLLTKGERLTGELEQFFTGYQPQASLLHGDLWSGNFGYDEKGEPVIFDPAVYYGDRETDIAMTELFGGFSKDFYAAYQKAWPLDKGYAQRKDLYNLYHVLNHFNLFGGGYASQAENMLDRLLSRR